MNSRKIKWSKNKIHYELTSFFADLLRIHYFFCESTLNLLCSSQIDIELTNILANSLSLSRIHLEFPFYFSQIHFHITIFIANSLEIPYLFSRFNFPFTFFFANLLQIHFFSHDSTLNLLCSSQIELEFTNFFANWFAIHYLDCEFTLNSLSITQITFEFTICCAN